MPLGQLLLPFGHFDNQLARAFSSLGIDISCCAFGILGKLDELDSADDLGRKGDAESFDLMDDGFIGWETGHFVFLKFEG